MSVNMFISDLFFMVDRSDAWRPEIGDYDPDILGGIACDFLVHLRNIGVEQTKIPKITDLLEDFIKRMKHES